MTPQSIHSLVFALVFIPVLSAGAAEALLYPADAGLVNVIEYGAVPNDGEDDTEAIQNAFDDNSGSGSVIFLPPGTYHIRSTIRWPGRQSFNALYGAGPEHTVLKLIDNAPGFDDPNKPRNMIWTGGPPAQRFRNSVRDITIDAGKGNPGAVGLNFCANNQGGVFNVVIRSGENGEQPGAVGLGLDEAEVGPLMVKDVTVIGFDLGIRVRHTVNSVTLEHITLRNQKVAGIDNFNNYVFARKVDSENSVPAIVNAGPDGIITLIDSSLRGIGGASERSAMQNKNPRATLYARNVSVEGYARAIQDENRDPVPVGHIDEWVSGVTLNLFPGEVRSLNLPIKETPTVPHDPLTQWVSPLQFGAVPGDGKDHTEAIQKAIDSGATTVYFPRAKWSKGSNNAYNISDTIFIRGNVRRLVGLEASFEVDNSLEKQPEKPIFVFENGTHPTVVLERLRFTFNRFPNVALLHRADRDLVVASFSELHTPRHEGKGILFMEDTVGPYVYVGPGSTLYARQLNIEGGDFKLDNDGGTVWVLGLKTECRSPVARNRKGGVTEIIGGHLYKCVKQGVDEISFVVDEGGQMSLAGVAEYCWSPEFATKNLVQETRDGVTRLLTIDQAPTHGNAGLIPLFSAFPTEYQKRTPAPAEVSVLDKTAATLTLGFDAAEPAGMLSGFQIRRGDTLLGRHRGQFRERNLSPDTAYTYQVSTLDRYGNAAPEVEVTFSTTPDVTAPSTPGNFHIMNVTDTRAHIRWQQSKDEIGVKGYRLERRGADGVQLQSLENTEFVDERVEKGATYEYRVSAFDAAGNDSDPAKLEVKVPDHPPYSYKQEAERYADGYGSINKGWFISNLHGGCWMLYPDLELGRTAPYDQITLRYGAQKDRAGCIVKVILNPEIETQGSKRQVVGGHLAAEFVVEHTGGWEDFQSFTLPLDVPRAGKHDVLLLIERGDAKAGNALVNIDWFEVGFANPPEK